MKTFLEYLAEQKKPKKPKTYKGTAVVISQGKHSQQTKPKTYKGTAVVISQGKHSKKLLNEKISSPAKHDSPFGTAKEFFDHHENTHLGPDIKSVDDHLHKSHPFDETPHSDALSNYTRGSSGLNRGLLHLYQKGTPVPKSIDDHNVEHLDAAVNHHALKHDLHVYSGVGFHPGHEASKDPENKIHLPAYTSTSTHKRTAQAFTRQIKGDHAHEVNHMLHVHLQPGQKGAYIGRNTAFMDEFDKGQHEHEFLLPRHTTLKIHPVPTVVPGDHRHADPHPTHIWHATVVPNESKN